MRTMSNRFIKKWKRYFPDNNQGMPIWMFEAIANDADLREVNNRTRISTLLLAKYKMAHSFRHYDIFRKGD